MFMSEISDRFVQVLKESGVPERSWRAQVSRVTKASVESARKWLTGEVTNIGSDYIRRFADHYGYSFEWLATGRGVAKPGVAHISSANPAAIEASLRNIASDLPGVYHVPKVGIPVLEKAQLSPYLNGEGGDYKTSPLAAQLASLSGGGERSFVYRETSDGMWPRISPGKFQLIDPDQKQLFVGKEECWLFKVGSMHILGYLEETPAGLQLKFFKEGPGWEPVRVEPESCIGRLILQIPDTVLDN